MSLGRGIAIAGIWLGVGMTGISAGPVVSFVSLMAMIATAAVAFASERGN